MGASLGYDLRGQCRRVVGVARRAEVVAAALASGCVDDATLDAPAAVAEADLVVLATPVRTILRHIAELGPLLKPGAVLLDLGSTKVEICQALDALPPHVQAIGGHPMCGKEKTGLDAAETGLYRGCTFVLCPLARTTPDTLALAEALIDQIGARKLTLDPERHDRLVGGHQSSALSDCLYPGEPCHEPGRDRPHGLGCGRGWISRQHPYRRLGRDHAARHSHHQSSAGAGRHR